MKTEFELSNANIPYGVLHDQILSDLKYENGELIFTFDIEIFENDYTDKSVYKKFKNFKKCEMKISLDNCEDTEISLAECIGKSGKYKALVIPIEKLIEISKIANYISFYTCLTNGYELEIKLSSGFYDAKGKFKKYKEFASIEMTLYASKITWNWY